MFLHQKLKYKKSVITSLKYGIYFYVFLSILLTLVSLHFQLNSHSIKKIGDSNSIQPSEYKDKVLLNYSNNLSLYKMNQNSKTTLVLFKNNHKTNVVFSYKETTALLTLITLLNISFLAAIIYVVIVTCKTTKQKTALLLVFLILNQYLLPWFVWSDLYINRTSLVPFETVIFEIMAFFLCSFSVLRITNKISNIKLLNEFSNKKIKNKALIAYASQSGTAASLAKSISKNLPNSKQYDIACFSSIKAHQLSNYEQVLFLASTYGDGEPPEKALSFMNSLHKLEHSLSSVTYAVLAFGDNTYPNFCAFGHSLAKILHSKGAQALLPVTEINRANELTIQHWWQTISDLLNWRMSDLNNAKQQTHVLSNNCLNPLSPTRPAHHIRLAIKSMNFSPGDLIDVIPKNNKKNVIERLRLLNWPANTIVKYQNKPVELLAALEHLEWQQQLAKSPQHLIDKLPEITARTYSIASCKEQGYIDLVVRKVIKNNLTLGLCSNYLTSLEAEQKIELSVKSHEGFHPPSIVSPIIMIAAGTGIAPFMGFLAQRQLAKNSGKAWLIMGERDPQQDNYLDKELTEFEALGCLHKRQHAWSQSENGCKYVAEIIINESESIRHWLLMLSAKIYICGNANTLGKSCNNALIEILGEALFSKLKENNQIKYDLY